MGITLKKGMFSSLGKKSKKSWHGFHLLFHIPDFIERIVVIINISSTREGCWPSGRADVLEPGGPELGSSSRQPQVAAHQH